MRYKLLGLLLLMSVLAMAQDDILERPNPPRLVNDYTSTLSRGDAQRLEQKLVFYNDSTSSQVAIIILETLNGYDVADLAQRTAQKWGIGQKGKDNGILILVALRERRMNINVGYGMEGVVPDAAAFRIIEDYLKPNFRSNNYYRGLDEATSVIFKLASGEFTADQVVRGRKSSDSDGKGFPFGFLFILFFFIIPGLLGKRRGRNSMGGRSFPWWVFLLGSGGSGRRHNNWDNFRGGGGGFGGGSGFGGGGGFGGFGGGSFGGGGASGSW